MPDCYGAGLYLIKKSSALKLINLIKKKNNKYDLTHISKVISDLYIYKNLNTYTIPLFTTNTDFESTIHKNHVNRIHLPSKDIITDQWKNDL